MNSSQPRTCTVCSGRGYTAQTRIVPDYAMGAALGSALGMGYFPSTKTEFYNQSCLRCYGTGKIK